MKTKIVSWLKTALKIGFAVGLIWWIVSTGKLDLEGLKKLLSPNFVLVGMSLVFLSIFAGSERWRRILVSQNLKLSSFEVLKLTFIGTFFNFAMPGGVGGDVIKAYYLASGRPKAKVAAVTSVAMDRILGLYSMISMALIVMLFDIQHVFKIHSLTNLFALICLLFFCSSAFLYLAFSKAPPIKKFIFWALTRLPLREKFIKLYESTHLYGSDPFLILHCLLLSFVAQTFSILVMIYAGESSGLESVPYSVYFLVAPLGFMATAIPISPAGLGVGQAAFYALFNIYLSQTTALGPTVITALQALQIVFGLFGAIVYMTGKNPKTLPVAPSEPIVSPLKQ
ncbi:MAG: flippase-like domain-containing protein [Bdellovibrionales bacterium]|nr:flippase-like domain-containing protein [Bdellovibrionales bacterium]